MRLRRDLNIRQATAWRLLHRIREATDSGDPLFIGPAEADETRFGDKEGDKRESKKSRQGRRAVDETAVVGVRDRESGLVELRGFEPLTSAVQERRSPN